MKIERWIPNILTPLRISIIVEERTLVFQCFTDAELFSHTTIPE